jgi:hypothetical protein
MLYRVFFTHYYTKTIFFAMKKLYTLFFCIPFIANAVTYTGNNNTGFGGVVGTAVLDVTEDANNIYFSLTKGSAAVNDIIVLYLDTKSGGFATTSGFTDAGDNLRKATSGFDGANRSTLNFNTNFLPDYAIALRPGGADNFGGLFELVNGGSHIFRSSAILSPNTINNAATYTFQIPKSSVVLSGSNVSFNFVTTYISNTAYRADEAMGFAIPGGNPGQNTITAAKALNYPSGFPLPISLLYFSGVVNSNNAQLNWATSSETNFSHFVIEKSVDGTYWKPIATVNGKNSSAVANYAFETELLSKWAAYRLKIVDKDGQYTYSKTVVIKHPTIASNIVVKQLNHHHLQVQVYSNATTNCKAQLLGSNGIPISSTQQKLLAGQTTMYINIEKLPAGIYYLQLHTVYNTTTVKLYIHK